MLVRKIKGNSSYSVMIDIDANSEEESIRKTIDSILTLRDVKRILSIKIHNVIITKSDTGHGRHIEVYISPLPLKWWERRLAIICLQAIAGSDPTRETYNLLRVCQRRWENILFTKKVEIYNNRVNTNVYIHDKYWTRVARVVLCRDV